MPVPMLLPPQGSSRAWGTLRHGYYDSRKREIDTGSGKIPADKAEAAIASGDCFVLKVPHAPGAGNEKPENGKLLDHGRLYKTATSTLALAGRSLPANSWLYVAKGIEGSQPPEIWLVTLLAAENALQLKRFGLFLGKPEERKIRLQAKGFSIQANRIDDISTDGSLITFAYMFYDWNSGEYKVGDPFSIKLSGSGSGIRANAQALKFRDMEKKEDSTMVMHAIYSKVLAYYEVIDCYSYLGPTDEEETGPHYAKCTYGDYIAHAWTKDYDFPLTFDDANDMFMAYEASFETSSGRLFMRKFIHQDERDGLSRTDPPPPDVVQEVPRYGLPAPRTFHVTYGKSSVALTFCPTFYGTYDDSIFGNITGKPGRSLRGVDGAASSARLEYIVLGGVVSEGEAQLVFMAVEERVTFDADCQFELVEDDLSSVAPSWGWDGSVIPENPFDHLQSTNPPPKFTWWPGVYVNSSDWPYHFRVTRTSTTRYVLVSGTNKPDFDSGKAVTVVNETIRTFSLDGYYRNVHDYTQEDKNLIDGKAYEQGDTPRIFGFRANNNTYGLIKKLKGANGGLYVRAFNKQLEHDSGWKKLDRNSEDPEEIIRFATEAFVANPDKSAPEFCGRTCAYV